MKRLQIHIITIFFILLTSCEGIYQWDFKTPPNELIIIDGIITNEVKKQSIKISKPLKYLNFEPEVISGAEVSIQDQLKNYILIESIPGTGIYETETTLVGLVGRTYRLRILYKNKEYTAETYMVPVKPMKKLSLAEKEKDSLYYVASTIADYDIDESAMYQIKIDWQQLSGYEDISPDLKKSSLMLYTLSTIDVSQIFNPSIEEVLFPKGSKIFRKKFSLTPEHAAFIRSVLLETKWRGGYFDAIPSNVKTNIKGEATGFFGACTVIKDSLIVQ